MTRRDAELLDGFAATLAAIGLPRPEREYRFAPGRRYRADLAWPDARLLVECDGGAFVRAADGSQGGRHNRGAGFVADMARRNCATLLGWRMLTYTPAQIRDLDAVPDIAQALGVTL